MTPYTDFLYFGLLAYVVVPGLIARAADVKPRHVILLATLVMVAVQYGLGAGAFGNTPGRDIGRIAAFAILEWAIATTFFRARRFGQRRSVFWIVVLLSLLPLALLKFWPGETATIVGFIGISYLTFRAIDVIVGIEDGLVQDLPATEYFAFLLFFSAISAGPIDRYLRFRADFRTERGRPGLAADLDAAVERMFRGMLYSFVIARLIDFYWLTPASRQFGLVGIVSYTYAYSLHLFFDFAGYSAFAIGVGYVFGVRMPENFNRPFLATNIADFWNRWHISLSSWLRDHIYGRFVLAAIKGRWFQDRYLAGYLGTILAFGLMGVWHGPSARYICYGLYHALLIVAYGLWTRSSHSKRLRIPPIAARLLTFHAVCFGFLVFSGRLI